jgi:hypothetical protein
MPSPILARAILPYNNKNVTFMNMTPLTFEKLFTSEKPYIIWLLKLPYIPFHHITLAYFYHKTD